MLAIESSGPFVKAGFCKGEIVVAMRRKLREIPAFRVWLSNDDEGNSLPRAHWRTSRP